MTRKLLILACFALVLVGETAVFGRRSMAGLLRLRGQRAFLRNEHDVAWRSYRKALDLGGDRDQIETDMVELLLFALDNLEPGSKAPFALPPSDSVRLARELIARRLSDTPYQAHLWALA